MTYDYLLYEKIDLYLKNALPDQEIAAFTTEINKDATLQELVKTQHIANTIVYTKQLIALQTKMQSDLTGYRKRYNLKSKLWILAIGIIKFALIGYFIDFSTPSTNNVPSFVLDGTYKGPVENFREPSKQEVQKKTVNPDNHSNTNTTISTVVTDSTTLEEREENKKSNHTIPNELTVTPSIAPIINTPQSKIDCSLLTIDPAITIFHACAGEQNGKIIINDLKINGGKYPFKFALHKKENLSAKNEFHYMNAGNYTLYISDANQCVTTKNIEIEEKPCKKANSFAFIPELEKWKIPVQENKQGTLTIFNKSGILVYTSEVFSDRDQYWDGTSSNGQMLETGYFTYKISYSDGEEEIGSVSIMRR